MNDLTDIADHASKQNYQWMFVALFIITTIVLIVIWRFMTSDREKLGNRLTEMTDRHIAATEKMTEVVANNTTALNEVKSVMVNCRFKGMP